MFKILIARVDKKLILDQNKFLSTFMLSKELLFSKKIEVCLED